MRASHPASSKVANLSGMKCDVLHLNAQHKCSFSLPSLNYTHSCRRGGVQPAKPLKQAAVINREVRKRKTSCDNEALTVRTVREMKRLRAKNFELCKGDANFRLDYNCLRWKITGVDCRVRADLQEKATFQAKNVNFGTNVFRVREKSQGQRTKHKKDQQI